MTPARTELDELIQLISRRVGRCLERQGLLEQDAERAWLDLDLAEDTDAMPQILGSSFSYRIAVGPQQGRKAFMLRTIRPLDRRGKGAMTVDNCEDKSPAERHVAMTWAQRLKRFSTIRSARTPLKTSRLVPLRPVVQE